MEHLRGIYGTIVRLSLGDWSETSLGDPRSRSCDWPVGGNMVYLFLVRIPVFLRNITAMKLRVYQTRVRDLKYIPFVETRGARAGAGEQEALEREGGGHPLPREALSGRAHGEGWGSSRFSDDLNFLDHIYNAHCSLLYVVLLYLQLLYKALSSPSYLPFRPLCTCSNDYIGMGVVFHLCVCDDDVLDKAER